MIRNAKYVFDTLIVVASNVNSSAYHTMHLWLDIDGLGQIRVVISDNMYHAISIPFKWKETSQISIWVRFQLQISSSVQILCENLAQTTPLRTIPTYLKD